MVGGNRQGVQDPRDFSPLSRHFVTATCQRVTNVREMWGRSRRSLDTAVTPEFLVAFRATPLEREETLVPHVQEHDFYVLRHPTGPT